MKGHIFVVDDDPGVRDGLRRLLVRDGYLVHEAEDGATALTRLASAGADLVILDLDMPGMNGLDVCGAFKKTPEGAETPVLFLTGSHDGSAYDRAIEVGADDFLSKPVKWPELRMRVQALVRLAFATRAQQAARDALVTQRARIHADELIRDELRRFFVQELQGPLAQIRHEAELRMEDAQEGEGWSGVYEYAEHALHLVTGWADVLAAKESGLRPRCEPTDLPSFLKVQAERHRRWLEARRVTWEFQTSPAGVPKAQVDRKLLERVFTHALDLTLREGAQQHITLVLGHPTHAPNDLAIDLLTEAPSTPGNPPDNRSPERVFCEMALAAMGGEFTTLQENGHQGYRIQVPSSQKSNP